MNSQGATSIYLWCEVFSAAAPVSLVDIGKMTCFVKWRDSKVHKTVRKNLQLLMVVVAVLAAGSASFAIL